MPNKTGETVPSRRRIALVTGLVASIALLAGCNEGKTQASTTPTPEGRAVRTIDTVICSRGTYLSDLTVDKNGAFSPAPGAIRIAYFELPDNQKVELYDPGHKVHSLAKRHQDRTDIADTNFDKASDPGLYRLGLNGSDKVTDVRLLKQLTPDQVKTACGHVAMSAVPTES